MSELDNVEAKVSRAKPKRSGGGVAIALVTLLMLLGGFGYAIYRRIQKSAGAEVAQAETPPADTPATEGDGLKAPVQPASADVPAAPATPAIAEAPAVIPEIPIAQAEPAPPAQPAGDPLLDIAAQPQAKVSEIPAEIPDIAQAEPAPAAPPAIPMELPDEPAAAPIDIAQAPDEMKLPADAPTGPAAQEPLPAAAPAEELVDLAPTQPAPVAVPVEQPAPEIAAPATIDASPATAGPIGVDERLGEYEPESGDSPATATTAPALAPAAAPQPLPAAGDPRFGEYEPDVGASTSRVARESAIEMVGGESLDPTAPVLATDEPVAIRPRQPARAPALELENLTAEEEPVPAIAPVPRRAAPTPIPTVAQPAAPQQPAGIYVVAPNDNFWQISRRVYGTARPFKALTKHFEQFGLQPQQLRPGMQLAIPPRGQLESQYPDLIDKNPSAFQGPGAAVGTPTSAIEPQPAVEFTARSTPPVGQAAPYDPAMNVEAIPVSAAAAPGQAAAFNGQPAAVYTVQPNDNFWQISKNVYGTARLFKALTAHFEQQGVSSQRLRAGMELPMPARAELEARFASLIDKAPAAIQQAGATSSPVLARGREMFSSPSFAGTPVVVGPELGPPDVVSSASPSLAAPEAEDAGSFFVGGQGQPMYKVGSDDTLTSIAQQHLGRASRWNEIFELNKSVLQTPDRLRPGLVIQLPGDASNISRSPSGVARQ